MKLKLGMTVEDEFRQGQGTPAVPDVFRCSGTHRGQLECSSGRDCARPGPRCSGRVSAPKPPVEGGTSSVTTPAGNEPLQRFEWSLISAAVPIGLRRAGRHVSPAATVSSSASPRLLRTPYEAIIAINLTGEIPEEAMEIATGSAVAKRVDEEKADDGPHVGRSGSGKPPPKTPHLQRSTLRPKPN
ncbi:hypothetical protein HPB50_006016 [Hyalomma asiaticum]|uniref:Uncharacterized protein n=1 Tax=Hyalomma asiaticum TaxID=266040 RepID=A0ACB7SQQ5_HYAAI|nr:hypothetical protein HPB50_006016 [Hyalomma asiaticum]